MNKFLVFSMLAFACVNASTNAAGLDYESAWECTSYKPNWYCDAKPSPAPEVQPPMLPKVEKTPEAKDEQRIDSKDLKTAEQLRKELKRREDIAVMNPTEANIKDYLELWTITQDKASTFTDQWRRVVWQNPQFDYSVRNPNNNSAIKIQQDQLSRKKGETLSQLAKKHGLIFFFRSDCQYCHAMAPVLKYMQEQFGFDVLGVSIDGGSLPEFPNPRNGAAVATKWGVDTVPALFIASKNGTTDHARIGTGMMAFNEIVERIYVLTSTQPGEGF